MIEATVAAQPSQLYTDRETNTITRQTERHSGRQCAGVCRGVQDSCVQDLLNSSIRTYLQGTASQKVICSTLRTHKQKVQPSVKVT